MSLPASMKWLALLGVLLSACVTAPPTVHGDSETLDAVFSWEQARADPREKALADWFDDKGINIHAFTMRLPKSFHSWLHSGGPRGGQWNEAWRQFVRQNNKTANQEDIWRFAFELMNRFYLNGSLVSYYCN